MINLTSEQDKAVERPSENRSQPRPPTAPRNKIIDGHDQENFEGV